jgi:hypothetical protein
MNNVNNAYIDKPRSRYEQLRAAYLAVGHYESIQAEDGFIRFGFYGLFQFQQSQPYEVEVYQAPSPRWCGKREPAGEILRDAYIQVLSLGEHAGNH